MTLQPREEYKQNLRQPARSLSPTTYYTNKSINSGLPGSSSMHVHCIGALVCASYAWDAYGDHFLHVGRGYSVDLYRILVIHALARAMWITSTGSRIVCLWMAVAWMRPV